MEYVNQAGLRESLEEDRAAYGAAEPFPHIALDRFLHDDVAAALEAQFPKVDHRLWKHHLHFHSHKFACNKLEVMLPLFQAVFRELNSKPLLEYVKELTGISSLNAGDHLEGGGLQQITPGGFLKVHADFNHQPTSRQHRRLNSLVHLNRGWQEAWDGNLELWSRDLSRHVGSVPPLLNRCVPSGATLTEAEIAYGSDAEREAREEVL